MPPTRLELKNEYGLGNRKLFCAGDSQKDDPKNILGGISVAGLVGILRQLGDLAEFAANVFHDLQEQVAATSSRWEKISDKIQHMESALPTLEKAVQGQRSCIHFAYIPGYSWHAKVLPDKNKLLMSHLPNFMVDLYEECRSPPQLHLLDKFDISGHGACLKRYSDPSYFKKALASSEPIIFQKGRRKKKRRPRQGIGLQHPVYASQCSNSTQYVSTNIGKLSFTSDVSFSDTMSSSEIARKSIQLESEMKSKNILEKFFVIPCLESDEPNYTSPFKLGSNHTNTFDFVCTEPKHDIALETNLKPDREGESLHSESEQKSSNTLEQFPLNSCWENAQSNNISVIESESNASDHIICSEPKQDFVDDDSQQHIIPNASFAASLETNLKPDWEGESLHSESEQKPSNSLEQFPLHSCLENAQSNNISVIESESTASDHIICSETKQDIADDDSQQHIILNASFAASLETDLRSDWEGESLHTESELKSSKTLEQFPVISCLESAQSNNISPIESESNASNHIICSEPKQDFADNDSQQRIIPKASFTASLVTNLKPDLAGESLHSESRLKSSRTIEQFPLISCLDGAQSNKISPIESESNASDHIICSETNQDIAEQKSSLSTSVVSYDETTEVVKPTCTSLYEHEVFNEDLNLNSLQVSHPSNSLNESPHFKNNDEEDTMFELAMEMPSATRFENETKTDQGSNHSNITTCDLETRSLEKTCSPNFDESFNFQDSSTIPNIVDKNQSSLSGSSLFNGNSNIRDQLSRKLSHESSIIDEQDKQTNDKYEKTELQNHSSDNFNPPAVHIWTNGNILGLEPSKPPDFAVKADSEAPTITSSSSVRHDNIQRKKLVANSGLSPQSLFMSADFSKLQKIIHHNDDTELDESETKENTKAGCCSPPLECMKISFLPMDDLKKTLLNLEFYGSSVHEGYDDIKYCYHSFHLISESSIGIEDSGQESDDDTFCRSSMFSDDDVFSYRSKASDELWEEDDQSQFQKHRVSSSAWSIH